MKKLAHTSRPDRHDIIPPHKMPDHFPAAAHRVVSHRLDSEVQVQIFRHRSTKQALTVPAVAEPLLVLVVSGAALVEERVRGQEWTANAVAADDFFLTMSPEPYEMRWQTENGAGFEVVHVYLSQRLLDLAVRDIFAGQCTALQLREVSGARDPEISMFMRALYREVTSNREASSMYLQGIGHALAVHLVRCYRDDSGPFKQINALPVYKLHRAIEAMREGLDSEFSLVRLASDAGMSFSHFSRMFRKATGQSPSQYFIHLRTEKACQLLLESDLSIVNVALEVGYNSPSHFAQVFRRHIGATPREYRQRR